VGEARAAYLPTLTGVLSRVNDRITSSDNTIPASDVNETTFQGGFTWRLFDFGGRAANHRAANNLLTAALANHNAALQKALSDVIQAYFDAMTAKAALKAAIEGEEIAKSTLSSAKVREEKGVVSQSDRLRATTALAKAVLENNRAHGNYQKALAVLGQIMGVPGKTVISMPEDITAGTGEISNDLNHWLEEAQKNHPAIIAAKEQLSEGRNVGQIHREMGITELTYYRWRKEYDGTKTTQNKRLKDLC
jgi:outer membrane protein